MNNELITLTNVWSGYQKDYILQDINLTINELDFLGIIGPNGGGKTTLIKLILGLLKPWRGEVKIMGREVNKGRQYLGYVPQILEFDRNFPVRVEDVVLMGRLNNYRLFKLYNKQDYNIVYNALDQVGILNLSKCNICELSGGQRQRVYIARALASQPRILILDEPTANVDPQNQHSIYELLKQLNQFITIVMISHDLEGISNYVKTLACLNRRLIYHGDQLSNINFALNVLK
jgi:zinc transport system ATP-binding protein